MIYVSYLIGKLIGKLYTCKAVLMFIALFSVNAIGLLLRIWVEWGETSLMNALSTMSIVIHLILVPTVILIFYLKTNDDNVKIYRE